MKGRSWPPPPWFNLRSVAGVVLFLTATFAGHRILEGDRAVTPVWSAGRDLAGGHVLSARDVRLVEVLLPAEPAANYVAASVPLEGSILTRPARSGELIPVGAVVTGELRDRRAMTVPADPQHAVGGSLRTGDVVDIYATMDRHSGRARTVLVAEAVSVIGVVVDEGLVGGHALVGITVSIDESDAASLAFAIRTGDVDIVRVEGAAPEAAEDPAAENTTP